MYLLIGDELAADHLPQHTAPSHSNLVQLGQTNFHKSQALFKRDGVSVVDQSKPGIGVHPASLLIDHCAHANLSIAPTTLAWCPSRPPLLMHGSMPPLSPQARQLTMVPGS